MSAPADRSLAILVRRLGALRRKLRGRFLLHGLGWILATTALLVLVSYGLDRFLDLPGAVRVLLTLGAATYLGFGLWRRILYPVQRPFSQDDLAIAVERRFPDLKEQVISALQLSARLHAGDPEALRNQSAELIAHTLTQAEARLAEVDVGRVIDPRRTLRIWGIGAACALAGGVVLGLDGTATGVWFRRLLGANVAYPRLTTLVLELPESGPELRVAREGSQARVELARGGDLRVLVRALGKIPNEVFLLSDGRGAGTQRVPMVGRGDGSFGHTFRRVTEGFSFHSAGGDDPTGDLTVTVETLIPPEIAGIVAMVTPPAYTGVPAQTLKGGPIEGLEYSRVRITVETTLPVIAAELRLEETNQRVALTAVPAGDGSKPAAGPQLAGEFEITRADRYSIDLTGDKGLHNVRPGMYPILISKDREPLVRVLTPRTGDDATMLKGALLPLRLLAEDDFGVVSLAMSHQQGPKGAPRTRVLQQPAEGQDSLGKSVYHTTLLEIAQLSAETPVVEGDILTLRIQATDNRQPTSQEARVVTVLANVVGEADLQRRLAGQFRRIREDVEKQLQQQEEYRSRVTDLVTHQSDAVDLSAVERNAVAAVDAGQTRVLAALARLHQDLMASFDAHLFNRLETSLHAAKVVERYAAFHRAHPEPSPFVPAFYAQLAEARQRGELGAMDLLDRILAMIQCAHRSSQDHGPALLRALSNATTGSASDARASLTTAQKAQEAIVKELKELLQKLDEWNEYQDLVQLARLILQRQKDIQTQTRTLARPK
jgi:hypothetical protein